MGVGGRLFRIIRASVGSKMDQFRERLFPDGETGYDYSKPPEFERTEKILTYPWDPEHSPSRDLGIFNLSEGALWDEVKRGYRAGCRKYHSDLYYNDTGKKEAAEEIMVIYNAAYARLKRHYQKK